jgi:hypothetical protein
VRGTTREPVQYSFLLSCRPTGRPTDGPASEATSGQVGSGGPTSGDRDKQTDHMHPSQPGRDAEQRRRFAQK